jgi:hypothetical protein
MGEVWTRYEAVMGLRTSNPLPPPRPFRSLLQLRLLPLLSLPAPAAPAGPKLGNGFRKIVFERDLDAYALLLLLLLDQSV